MVTKYLNYTNEVAGPAVSLLLGENAVIGRFGFAGSTDGIGLSGAGSNSVQVQGMVSGHLTGILLGSSATTSNTSRLTIDAGGAVWGGMTGAFLRGHDLRVTNHGAISGDAIGLRAYSNGSGLSYIYNDGVIEGGTFGLQRQGSETGIITNHGTIRGLSAAIQQDVSLGSGGRLQILNDGLIEGDILGGSGSDYYRSTGSGSLLGRFVGGSGDDTFASGAAAETIDGGLGTDSADYSARSGVVLYLDGITAGEGGAMDDLLISVETVIGSRLGGDRIYGYGANNRLEGRGGADVLSGGAGNDTLIGGSGADTLSGGSGNDVFIFNSLAEAADKISDFSSSALGNNDVYQFRSAAFGSLALGTLAASRFVARADNLAQDLDDRFIFRTTDKTLWFDANGKTAGGLTMILDHVGLNGMTYQDIVII